MLLPIEGLGWAPPWLATILGVVDLVIRVAALGIVPGNRRPTTAMAWLLAIFFIPLLGLALFLMFGKFSLSGRRRHKQEAINRAVMANTEELAHTGSTYEGPAWVHSATELNRRLGAFPVLDGNKVEFHRDYVETIRAMTAAVRESEKYVHVEFYIMAYDHVTRDFFDALEDVARRGVQVRLLFDHLGTLRVSGYRKLLAFLEQSEIQWRRMLPVRPIDKQWRRPDLRNHRKILVIDGLVAFTGSQNLTEPSYNNKRHRRVGRKWVEFMVRLEGPIVAALNVVFATDWNAETDETLQDELIGEQWQAKAGDVTCQVVPSGPGFATENNLRLFNSLIYSAVERISICSPYFVPDDSLLYAITTAAERGVDVELFVSEKGDQFLVDHAQRSYYEVLMEAGIRIYLYPAPLVLHAKHFTIDNEVGVLGSSNMDMRSFSLNFEVSLMMMGTPIVGQLREAEDVYREKSRELLLDEWRQRPRLHRYVDNVARLTATLQ